MTVPELIANVLENVLRHFYTDLQTGTVRIHEYKRDERQLIKAIATYGHECNQRGWQFQADFIYRDLTQLLLKIRTSGAKIEYLPVYLAGAIRRHIGTRAEELNAQAKAMDNRVAQVLSTINPQPATFTRQPSDVELFTALFKGINRINRSRRIKRPAREKQASLL